jgi:xanthine dehydrogenase iron-sulfur cluster and FAD-binding subunit A
LLFLEKPGNFYVSKILIKFILMAVPKKRLSKSKTQLRKTKWREKAIEQAKKAFARSLSEFKKRPSQEAPESPEGES